MAPRRSRRWLVLAVLAGVLAVLGIVAISVVQVTYTETGSGPCGSSCWQFNIVGTAGRPYLLPGEVLVAGAIVASILAVLLWRKGHRGPVAAASSK